MNTKYTPGPWGLEANDSVVVMSGQAVIVGPAPDWEPFARQQANARLIASAPDLLAMLERALRLHDYDPENSQWPDKWADEARALIAQIKGE